MIATLLLTLLAQSGPHLPWKAWGPLLGEWVADAEPDGGTGGFTLDPSVEGRVLVRKNRADYPASKDRPAAHHEDLMVVFHEGGATRADYFDNEGHVIHYKVTIGDGQAQFVSDKIAHAPRFRLTYLWTDAKALTLTFEVAPPENPDGFRPYIKGTLHRK